MRTLPRIASPLTSHPRVWVTETAYRALGAVSPLRTMQLLDERLRNERMPPNDLTRLAWRRLQAILRHCWEHQPFYHRHWRAAGVDPTRFRRQEDTRALPVVTKADLTAARLAGAFGREDPTVRRIHTSGTTAGMPFVVLTTFDTYQKKYANHLRQFYATGWRLGMRSAALHNSGHGQFRGRYTGEHSRREPWHRWRDLAFSLAHHRMLLTPYHFPKTGHDEIIDEWERRLRRFSPYVLDTFYVNALMLGDFVERKGLAPLPVPALFILGTLTPAERARLERTFAGSVFNRYSPHECEGIAVACGQSEGMHVAVDSYVVEILNELGTPLPPGEAGNIVITDLENFTMPLIRYQIGDLAHSIAGPCVCGRTFPRISDLHGRQSDIIGSCRGRAVAPWEVERLLQGHPKILFFQIMNTGSGITIQVVTKRGAQFAADEATTCARQVAELFDPQPPVEVVLVDSIPFEPSGKFRFVKNEREIARD